MANSIFAVFADLETQIGDDPQEFALTHLNQTIADLQSAILALEMRKVAAAFTPVSFDDCDRIQQLAKRAASIQAIASRL